MIPKDLKYSRDHEWVSLKGNMARVGLTEYGQKTLNDVVFVEMPLLGEEFEVGQSFAIIDSIKTVNDIYIPLAGKINKVNENVLNAPELINKDPYGNGWLVELEVKGTGEFLTAQQYEAYLQEQLHG